MAASAGVVYLDVLPNLKGFQSQVQGGMKGLGSSLTRSLTPVAAGIAVAWGSAFQSVDEGLDSIRVATGATGDELKGLEGSAKRVAGQVTQPFSEVGKTMGDLAARTGLTGKPLEDLTKQVLNLAKITGGDAQASVAGLTRVFGDWGVESEDQAATMDMLFRASQETGIGIDQLSGNVVRFGAPLRQMGFSLEESAGLFGKFEKEGVNSQLVVGSMRIALGKLAREGVKDVPAAFKGIIKSIKNAGSVGEANAQAMELFGARAGPDMAAAIREGRFDIEELFNQIKGGKDTISTATKDTEDLGDSFAKIKNKVVAVLGPFGEIGSVIFGAVAAIGPMIFGLGALTSAQGVAAAASRVLSFAMTALPFVAIAAAVILLAVIIFKNWDTIKKFLLKVWDVLKKAGIAVWNAIKGVVLPVFNFIKGVVKVAFAVIVGYFKVWFAVVKGIFNAVKAVAKTVFGAIKGIFNTFKGAIIEGWNAIKAVGVGIWDAIKEAAILIFNAIARIWNSTVGKLSFRAPSWLPLIGGKGFDVPDIPTFAHGGLVAETGLAVVHRGEVFSGVNRDFGPFGRSPMKIEGRLTIDENGIAFIRGIATDEDDRDEAFQAQLRRMRR
jgi:hypothetical protein